MSFCGALFLLASLNGPMLPAVPSFQPEDGGTASKKSPGKNEGGRLESAEVDATSLPRIDSCEAEASTKPEVVANKSQHTQTEHDQCEKGAKDTYVKKKSTQSASQNSGFAMNYFCRDLRGKRHDIVELRKLRNQSVLRGMNFMRKFLRKGKYKALYEIGDDAPAIFFEIWYTSADSRIRAYAKTLAREMLGKLERRLLRSFEPVPTRDDFFALMFLARMRYELEDYQKCDALLEIADKSWQGNGFANTDTLFGVASTGLHRVGTEPWLELIMRILIMEYNNLLFPRRYRLQWGMGEALRALRKLELAGPGEDDFHNSFFLATHIVYALGAYNAVKTSEKDCPWLYLYLRESMRHWAKENWRRMRVERAAEKGTPALESAEREFVYVDIDGVSEIVDIFRGCGLTSASDRMVCEGSLFLLSTQRKNGSWPYWNQGGDGSKDADCNSYDLLHPSWVAVQALRDRDFKLDRPAAEKWKAWIDKLVLSTRFSELEYSPPWLRWAKLRKEKSKQKSGGRKKAGLRKNRKKKMVRGKQKKKATA